MNRAPLFAVLLLALPLRLIPPGRSEKEKDAKPAHPPMPAALAHGSRASYDHPIGIPMRALVSPSPAKLGQQLTYHAHAYLTGGDRVQFARPEAGGDFTWGEPRAGHKDVTASGGPLAGVYVDSAWVEMPLQVFKTGLVNIPGPNVRITDAAGKARVTRLPTVHLIVAPSITAADTNATLRPLHGPLVAPWWERVPWRYVAAVMLLVALAIAWWRWLVSRRRRPVAAPAAVAMARPVVDPSAEALAALNQLRDLALPEQGRFGEHALGLTRIQRRFLERTLGTPQPGDTSPELLNRLRASRLEPEDITRLEGLLGLWDRVKFARAALDAGEAHRCEDAVERLVRRRESPREVA